MPKNIRLLSTYNGNPPGTILNNVPDTLADQLLLGGVNATLDLTGGTPYVPPPVVNTRMPAQLELGPNGEVVRIAAAGGGVGSLPLPGRVQLPKWRAAVAKMRSGGAVTPKLAILGSSTVAGHGAGTRANSFVARLAQLLNANFAPATSGGLFGGSYSSLPTLTGFDSRVVAGTGWVATTAPSNDSPLGSFSFKNTANTTGLLQFTPTEPFNIIDVYVKKTANVGTISVSIDGGTTALASSGPGAGGSADELGFFRGVAGTVGNHTVTLKATAQGTDGVEVYAIRTYSNQTRAIDVFQWAHSGGTAENFLANPGNKPWTAYNQMNRYAPDLALFVVASNVWTSAQPMDTFKNQMQSLISRLKETSDVGLISGIPTQASAVPLSTQQMYVDAAQELAAINRIPFLDNWRRFGNWEQANDNGLMFDAGHMNPAGHFDFAAPTAKMIAEL